MSKNIKILFSLVVVILIGAFVFTQMLRSNQNEQIIKNTLVTEEKTTAQSPIAYEVINGISVPPEPDPELNNATLAGIDVNENGVRDDVERWIVRTIPDSQKTRAGLIELSKQFELALFASAQNIEADAVAQRELIADAVDCLWYMRPGDASTLRKSLFAQILNTKARSLAYASYNTLIAGEIRGRKPDEFKLGCTAFDPDSLPN